MSENERNEIEAEQEEEVSEPESETISEATEVQAQAPAAASETPAKREEGETAIQVAPKGEIKPSKPKKEEAKGEEEGKKEKEEKEEEEDKVVEEKALTINLRHAYLAYSRKQTPRSVKLVKKIASKVFKTEDVKIDNSLNNILWQRGKTKAQRRVSVKVQKLESGTVRVVPAPEA
jgi:large subunit ribosomal protein L31e